MLGKYAWVEGCTAVQSGPDDEGEALTWGACMLCSYAIKKKDELERVAKANR